MIKGVSHERVWPAAARLLKENLRHAIVKCLHVIISKCFLVQRWQWKAYIVSCMFSEQSTRQRSLQSPLTTVVGAFYIIYNFCLILVLLSHFFSPFIFINGDGEKLKTIKMHLRWHGASYDNVNRLEPRGLSLGGQSIYVSTSKAGPE